MRTENKRKTMVQKKENGVLSVPSELLLTVCKPYLKVFDELGIEPNEVEALMGKEKRTR